MPSWSIPGRRVEKGKLLDLRTSTTIRVGPGRYSPDSWKKERDEPKYSFTKTKRELPLPKAITQHETYDPTKDS
jgi:hypothetical protein